MAQAGSTGQQHGEEEADNCDSPEVSPEIMPGEVAAQASGEADAGEVGADDLQAGVGTELEGAEGEGGKTIDTAVEIGFPSSHWEWPFGRGFW